MNTSHLSVKAYEGDEASPPTKESTIVQSSHQIGADEILLETNRKATETVAAVVKNIVSPYSAVVRLSVERDILKVVGKDMKRSQMVLTKE